MKGNKQDMFRLTAQDSIKTSAMHESIHQDCAEVRCFVSCVA